MALIRIDRDPPPRKLRLFSLFWLVAFSFLGYLAWKRSGLGLPAQTLWAMALLVPLLGVFYLPLLRWAWIGLAYLTFPIGWVVSHVVLALVFFAVITPIGLVLRLTGRDSMKRQFDRASTSYWTQRRAPLDPARYYRQF